MGLFDTLRDKSILFSFDRSGYRRHAKGFNPVDLDVPMDGKVCAVTGANSGLGFEVARGLAVRGASVHMLCRNAERGEEARTAITDEHGAADVHVHVVDLSRLCTIRSFAETFSAPRLDVLVHNAGLLPLERKLTEDGLELTVATHLVGPFLLTELLRAKLGGARIVFVSSGGMYAKRLDVGAMLSNEGDYDGVAAYAMTKRGQVVLAELLAEELKSIGATVNSMHPGWAATKGVEHSLPRFWKMMRNRLRNPAEGADTALWLAVAEMVQGQTGKFWFDRKAVPTHLMRRTREDEQERRRLWEMCESYSHAQTTPEEIDESPLQWRREPDNGF
jgi:NAD(P)-dependent dehydrogenase (short-subunit alcohol dehydrogenase family)